MKLKDLSNKKFNRLTVTKYVKNSKWLCKCDCGNYKEVLASHLQDGHTKSCGCLFREKAGSNFVSHNKSKTKLYKIYRGIIDRTQYSSNKSYKNYGGRGIKICDEWKNDFMNFYNWSMNNGYEKGLTIDRIDVNGNYEPSNCRWVDKITQGNNKRNNIYYEYHNEKHTLPEWSRITKIPFSTLRHRLERGWDIEKVLK